MMRRRGVSSSIVKRSIDLLVSAAGLLFLMPALLVVALIIKLDSDGPVFSRQTRAGLNGKRFNLYAFRTFEMAAAGREGCQTPFGRILRRTSLDEVPHLFNILRGEMSFVGPRSYTMAHDQTFSALMPNYEDRFQACPGLTCLAQVRGLRGDTLSREDMEKCLAYDLEYIETWSVGLDFAMTVRTLPILFDRSKR